MRINLLMLWVLTMGLPAIGQTPAAVPPNLPSAPSQSLAKSQTQNSMSAQSAANAPQGQLLTLKEAEVLAIRNNPQISVGRLQALASEQATRQVRSNLWPTVTADLTAVDALPNSRITAGGLNNPIIYERAAGGITGSQLITDFGRTTNLVASANLAAKAEAQNALATNQQILLAVTQAFYNVLQTHAVLRVAEETVKDRQLLTDQVSALAANKLKSQLDLSFANVNLAQAKLLLLDAQNNDKAAQANLSAVLGFPTVQNYSLADDTEPVQPPAADADTLITEAFAKRPEIQALDYEYQSLQKFKTAERDLLLPSVRALGAVGGAPVRNDHLSSWYWAVGANVDVPIFNGFLYSARAREADLRSQAARERLLDLRNRISRDVRTAWLNATSSYQRLSVTQQLVQQAQLALDLSQSRYQLGLASIVELSQAQLQATQAEISNAQAGYDYRQALAALRYQTSGL
jgi:outer membrane protein